MTTLLTTPVEPDHKALIANLLRKGTPKRVHNIELYLDAEVQDAVCQRFDLLQGWNPSDPYADLQKQILIQPLGQSTDLGEINLEFAEQVTTFIRDYKPALEELARLEE